VAEREEESHVVVIKDLVEDAGSIDASEWRIFTYAWLKENS